MSEPQQRLPPLAAMPVVYLGRFLGAIFGRFFEALWFLKPVILAVLIIFILSYILSNPNLFESVGEFIAENINSMMK